MQSRVEHEFVAEDNQALVRLSEELSRFSLMTGVVGMALVGLGVAAMVTGGYQSGLTGPAIIVLGLVAMFGGVLFLRPRTALGWISSSRGSDVTKLMDALKFLDTAHGVFRLLVLAFVLARLASFLLIRLS
jgi:hypothetical protein